MTVAEKKIRILIADDHAFLREGIAAMLRFQHDMELVAEAGDGKDAVDLFVQHRPDIVLMDLQMPVMNGIEAIREICKVHPVAKIIVLTTYQGDAQVHRAIMSGATGYLLKSMLKDDLINAIHNVYAGRKYIPPEVAVSLAEHYADDDLSKREIEVLRLVALGNSNKRVALQLHISEDTVKSHVKAIMAKLGANDRTHSVTIAMKRGFIEAW